MTDQKLFEVITRYENDCYQDSIDDHLRHVAVMLPQMREMVVAGRREKLMRWLGWVQAVLVISGCYTLEDVKNHNKPDTA